jgi:hypothetical protein
MPALLGWEDADLPILALEELSAADWPPPWTDDRVISVLQTLEAVAATPPPPGLSAASASGFLERGWEVVKENPRPLLSTGLVAPAWVDTSLPMLTEAANACALDGPSLLHLDVRSDNICFRADGSAVLVDWNLAVIGTRASTSPSGGQAWPPRKDPSRKPSYLMPAMRRLSLQASSPPGRHASHPWSPAIRPLQFEQLRYALPWACRELDLPPPW